MIRRSFVLGALAAGAFAPAAGAHTLYPQWVAYRRKHLLIGCHRKDPETYRLCQSLVEALNHAMPKAQARVARAPHPQRLASLIGTDQMELAVLSAPDAVKMAAGAGRFAPYGRIALTRLLELGDHLLVAEAGFPVRHGWMATSALHDSGLVRPLTAEAPGDLHAGAQAFADGLSLDDLPND
ncbi:MAG: hypothetical protein AAGH68_09095 [Pseudomonadota bacterium]